MIELRAYQQKAVEEIRAALNKYRRVLFCAPCGMGKTICFSYIAGKQHEKGLEGGKRTAKQTERMIGRLHTERN